MNQTLRFTMKWLLVAIMGTLLFGACQQEKVEIVLPPAGTTTSGSTLVADLISQVSSLDGSKDNILDKSSCISIVLPVTVKTNGQTITIDSLSELGDIEELIDNSGDDDVDFVFPIKVVLADHTEKTVQSESDLENLIKNCSSDDDIECIDFEYPIQFNTYDVNNQVAGTVTIKDDGELHTFFKQLKGDEIVGLKFPITLTKSNGVKVIVNNFEELEKAIKDASDDCDEDDDNDFDDDDADDTDFVTVLTSGKWEVNSYIDGTTDKTSTFTGFSFTFKADGTATAEKSAAIVSGTWETDGDDGEIELEITLSENDPLDDISEDWTVKEFSATSIRLVRSNNRVMVLKKL